LIGLWQWLPGAEPDAFHGFGYRNTKSKVFFMND